MSLYQLVIIGPSALFRMMPHRPALGQDFIIAILLCILLCINKNNISLLPLGTIIYPGSDFPFETTWNIPIFNFSLPKLRAFLLFDETNRFIKEK